MSPKSYFPYNNRGVLFTLALVCIHFFSFGATISSTGTGGNWNATASWVGGVVPTAADDVIIVTGATVNLTTNQTCNSLTVDGTGILNLNTNTITLTITNGFTLNGTSTIQGNATTRIINVGGAFSVPASQTPTIQDIALAVTGATQIDGTLTFNTGNTASKSFASVTISSAGTFTNTSQNVPISISGDFLNSGTFSQGTGRVTFTGATSNVVAGISTSAFGGGITVNKGASQANILDVQSLITMSNGGLVITNGTFRLTSASTIVPFTANPGFGASARLWCNGGTMNSTAIIDWTFGGALQVSAGTVTVGTALNDRLIANDGTTTGTVTISGGALNITGRITGAGGAGADWNYIMSGGVLTVATVGNTGGGSYPFFMNTTTSSFSMSGGTIIIERPNNGGTNGCLILATGGTFTGGTLQIGDASTPAASTIGIDTTVPIYNLLVNSANATALVQTQAITVSNNVTISSGTLSANNLGISVAGNWTNNGAFTPGTATVTFNGTAAQSLGGTTSTTFNNLTLNNTFATIPQIALGIGTTVNTTLTMTSGVVNLAGFTFTLGASGAASTLTRTASATTNWMYGGTFSRFWPAATAISSTAGNFYGLFPVGAATASSYRPVEINSTVNPTATGSYSVTHTDASTVTDLSPVFNDGGTNIVRKHNAQFVTLVSGVTGGTYNMGVTMTGLLAGTLSDIRLAVSNGATTVTTVGTHAAATGTAPNPTANRTGVTLAGLSGDFRITTTNLVATPLPIELISFNASLQPGGVELNWITASELNNDFFTIERSGSGEKFEKVKTLKGKGTTNLTSIYQDMDEGPLPGTSYYRLKQTDFDGKFSYSEVRTIENNNPVSPFKVYPNPIVNNKFVVEMNGLPSNAEVPLSIINMQGAIVLQAKYQADDRGHLMASVELNEMPGGIYLVVVNSATGFRKKIVIP